MRANTSICTLPHSQELSYKDYPIGWGKSVIHTPVRRCTQNLGSGCHNQGCSSVTATVLEVLHMVARDSLVKDEDMAFKEAERRYKEDAMRS